MASMQTQSPRNRCGIRIKENNKKKSYLFLLLFLSFFLSPNLFALENKIILKINNKIITTLDVHNEIKILKLLNQNFSRPTGCPKFNVTIFVWQFLSSESIKKLNQGVFQKPGCV